MFIGGAWKDSVSGESFSDFNPYTGDVFAEVPKGNAEDAHLALSAAYAARKGWAHTVSLERARILFKASEYLQAHHQEFAEVLTAETGAMVGKAVFETLYTVDLLHTAGEDCRRVVGDTIPSDRDNLSMTLYRPLGTVVAISPWNFPLLLSVHTAAYALAAGNTVVLKPSSETPVIGIKIAEIFENVGLPSGVLNVLTGPGSILGNALVEDERTSLICLTGQTLTARRVAENAAAKLKKFTLEPGGKDTLIILADADMDHAVDAAASGSFMGQGQICMSAERIIVEAAIADEFAGKLAAKAEKLTVGDPAKPETMIGPIINDRQIKRIHIQVNDAVAKGARLLTGGCYEGRLYKPTVLIDVTRDMMVFREETFGPVAPIMAVKDEKEAVAVANDTNYGISAGVLTNDLQKALFLAENLESGMVHIMNSSVHDEPYYPFGGCRAGVVREGGRHSLKEMSELKRLTLERGKRHFPF